jgi:hypothetical protein
MSTPAPVPARATLFGSVGFPAGATMLLLFALASAHGALAFGLAAVLMSARLSGAPRSSVKISVQRAGAARSQVSLPPNRPPSSPATAPIPAPVASALPVEPPPLSLRPGR